jgi:hypothetical protein
MRNPRPCVCGHGPEWHRGAIPGSHCRLGVSGADCNFCPAYRPAQRTEPLRARRGPSYDGRCPRCYRRNRCNAKLLWTFACPHEHPCWFCGEPFDIGRGHVRLADAVKERQ